MVSLSVLLQVTTDDSVTHTIKVILHRAEPLLVIGIFILLLFLNRKVNDLVKSIPGLLGKKELADKAIGAQEERDAIAKAVAAENAGKLLAYQQHKDAVTAVREVKKEIVEAVEEKGDETQDIVEQIPEKVAEKIKTPPDSK